MKMKAQKWILAKHFEGVPKESDLELVEEELPNLTDGGEMFANRFLFGDCAEEQIILCYQVLVFLSVMSYLTDVLLEALYLSVDPYMRPYSRSLPVGSVMIGEQVARVVDSKNAKYAKGDLYLVQAGWRSRFIVNPDKKSETIKLEPTIDTGSHPSSLNISVLGMPGKSAYAGLMKLCDPKPGETVYVNSAAGIVGSVVGQIAKIKGCRVIGSAGTDEKVNWLTSELGFDYAFNYKTCDWKEALKEAAPNGIDCFFENVGDEISDEVIMNHMNRFGRVAICGCISQYNADSSPTGPRVYRSILSKELNVRGFFVYTFTKDYQAMLADLKQWVDEGKLKYHEDVVEGFENMRQAFYGMLSGKYSGKVIVKATV